MVHLSESPENSVPIQFLSERLPREHRPSERVMIPPEHLNTSANNKKPPCPCQCVRCFCACCVYRAHRNSIDQATHAHARRRPTAGCILENPDNFPGVASSSVEARQPDRQIAPPSLDLLNRVYDDSQAELAEERARRFAQDMMDDAPYNFFISEPSPPSDQTMESSDFIFGALEEDDRSMENNHGTSRLANSGLSSYESAMSVRSHAASDILRQVGSGFGSRRPSQQH